MSLIVVGSGPGIGLSTAKQLALKHFNKVALISRNAQRLSEEKTAVLDATKQTGKELTVEAFPTDICDLNALRKTFEQIEAMGPVGCVFFNAARIQPSELLKTSVEEIEEDFKVSETVHQSQCSELTTNRPRIWDFTSLHNGRFLSLSNPALHRRLSS